MAASKHLCSITFLCRIFIYFIFLGTVFSSLQDVTTSVGLGGNERGVLAAFGDFNADKKTDLFFINNSKDMSKVDVYLWDGDGDEFKKASKATIELKHVFITNVIPGDFNSDGHLDALLSFHNTTTNKKDETFVKIYLGIDSKFELDRVIVLGDALKDQPAIVDYDGDLQPDLLAEKSSDGERYFWKFDPNNNSLTSKLMETKKIKMLPLSMPHSCAFLDINGDYAADLVVTTLDATSQFVQFEVWLDKEGVLTADAEKSYSQPDGVHVVGQSTFADIDSDGLVDHILPVCCDKDCSKSEVYVYSRTKKMWSLILNSIQKYEWKFIKSKANDNIPLMTLRIGDYDMDGYPDAAMVVDIKEGKENKFKRILILLENVACSGRVACYNGRRFSMSLHNNALYSIENPVMVGFFDLNDNGLLDIMAVSLDDTTKTYRTHVVENTLYSDTCFLKVMVLGGSCYSDCQSGVTPYGVNQAGPFVKYVTTGLHGETEQASATQLSQAAYFALQLPYILFGLGRTPNFVEKLIIGLPQSPTSGAREHTWTSIIPNSQVIIIPYPPDDPSEWKSKLLVTPSKLVLLTGGALLATCVFIGFLIALLHWKEKKEDRREKQEAAHKFHFDAM